MIKSCVVQIELIKDLNISSAVILNVSDLEIQQITNNP